MFKKLAETAHLYYFSALFENIYKFMKKSFIFALAAIFAFNSCNMEKGMTPERIGVTVNVAQTQDITRYFDVRYTVTVGGKKVDEGTVGTDKNTTIKSNVPYSAGKTIVELTAAVKDRSLLTRGLSLDLQHSYDYHIGVYCKDGSKLISDRGKDDFKGSPFVVPGDASFVDDFIKATCSCLSGIYSIEIKEHDNEELSL